MLVARGGDRRDGVVTGRTDLRSAVADLPPRSPRRALERRHARAARCGGTRIRARVPALPEVEEIEERLLLDERQDHDEPGAEPIDRGGSAGVRRRQHLPRLAKRVDRHAELPQVVRAAAAPRRLAGALHGREQETDEHRDDGDHDEQFDERERTRSDATSTACDRRLTRSNG